MQKNISENEKFEEIKKKVKELEAVCMCGGSTPTEPLDLMKEIKKLIQEGNLLSFETPRMPTEARLREAGILKIEVPFDPLPLFILPPGSKSISSTCHGERIQLPTGKTIKFIIPSDDFGYFTF